MQYEYDDGTEVLYRNERFEVGEAFFNKMSTHIEESATSSG